MKKLPPEEDGSSPPNEQLDDLISRHFDGGLDPAEQRRLAALLAGSASARGTLGDYLRLEGAIIRLGAAAMVDGAWPHRDVAIGGGRRWTSGRGRRLAAGAAISGGLVAAVVAWVLVDGNRTALRPDSDADVVAAHWLTLQAEDATRQGLSSMATELAAGDELQAVAEQPEPDLDDLPQWMPSAPPAWLVTAVAEQGMRQFKPDEG